MSLLKELPEKQRDIFQLREVEGLDYSEIASHLDISLDQVKVNLHRARKRIREWMINQKLKK
jgi:RNA polymerase sigma-70 factor (ECF subfamily)